MTQNHSTSAETNPLTEQPSKPDPALKCLERLIGTWDIKGRTLDSKDDNISGRVMIEWLPGGFFLQQRGELDFMGFKAQSLFFSWGNNLNNCCFKTVSVGKSVE